MVREMIADPTHELKRSPRGRDLPGSGESRQLRH